MQTMVQVGADTIWAEDSGWPESRPAGQALVLLHEGVGDSRMWDPIWRELTAGYRTIRYDVRGYGRSPAATQKYTLLADLAAVLDHFGVAAAHFAGCSMGGGTALELAAAEPSRVQSLVLLCPGISGYPYPDDPELEAQFNALEAAGDNDGIVRLAEGVWAAAGSDPFITELMRSGVHGWTSDMQWQEEGEPVWDRLGDIRVPTVIMVGDKDNPALIASNEEAVIRIPGCELIRMPGVDHYPTVRVPRLVLEAIGSHCR
ncbi:MAG: alpha/beta fold hydrolase [Streptosporangiaceae bacterium]